MTPFKDWLEETNVKIAKYKNSFTKAESRKYRLAFLERVAKRVNEFSPMCGECYNYKGEITSLLNNLEGLIQLSPIATKNYRDQIKKIVDHLRKKHKLIPAGTRLNFLLHFFGRRPTMIRKEECA